MFKFSLKNKFLFFAFLLVITLAFAIRISKIEKVQLYKEEAVGLANAELLSEKESAPLTDFLVNGRDKIVSELNTEIVYAVDLDSRKILLDVNSDKRWPMASLTKLMNAVVASEKLGLEKEVVITEDMAKTLGSNGGLKAGEVYTVNDLIKAMLVVSANDAAVSIAKFYGQKEFIDEMQKKAVDIGMSQTSFTDESGLSFLNQSTAKDLEKLIEYIVKNHPNFLDVTTKSVVELKEINTGSKRFLANINSFAGRKNFLGGKTGFISYSGDNLISLFQHYDKRLFIIVMGAKDRIEETSKILNWIKTNYL